MYLEYPSELSILIESRTYRTNQATRLFYLSFMIVLIYVIVGFCLASLQTGLQFWSLGILIYHWCLIQLDRWQHNQQWFNNLSKIILRLAFSVSMMGAIAKLIDQTKPNLPLYHAIALGLTAVLNTLIMIALMIEHFGKFKTLVLSTSLAWTGLLLGWLVQYCQLG